MEVRPAGQLVAPVTPQRPAFDACEDEGIAPLRGVLGQVRGQVRDDRVWDGDRAQASA